MTNILVTGVTGYIGRHLCDLLVSRGHVVSGTTRTSVNGLSTNIFELNEIGDLGSEVDWEPCLQGIDCVIHLAARVHVMGGGESDALAGFREINVEGTRNLATQAAGSGVKRFVYLSSIKVNGERTDEEPFSADQTRKPEDPYAVSKMEAEIALREIEAAAGMELVIIRPPLVYGPGAKGNLAALARMIKKGIPLPLGALNNRRDLVSIHNLCDLIRVCCQHPAAAGKTFLVSDGESISTAELIRYMAKGLDQKARLFFVPIWALKLAAGLFGKAEAVEKLTGNLEIDMSTTMEILDWKPPLTVTESFRKMFAEE